MTTMIKPAPVRKSLVVKAPPERAFSVFTAGIGRWWPPSHHIGAAAFKDAVVEPRAGGRWYEIGEDGSECQWGHVIAGSRRAALCSPGRSAPPGPSIPTSSPRWK